MNKPNILFIFADQMRGSAMGCAGEKVYTPNLDKLASEGTRFTRAVSNTPVCGPVRASIMTGLCTLHHRLVNNDKKLESGFTTLAGCLGSNGYDCGYIGKWHMGPSDRGAFIPPGPDSLGFDDFWASYNCNHQYFDGYYYLDGNPEPKWIDGYEPFGQTKLASDYISRKSREDKPYCLFLSFGPPHCPYKMVPQKYLDMYPVEKIELKPNTPETADKSIIAGYYAHITALDECLGEIIKTLEDTGTAENTLVVFTSDHGDMLFSQDRGWKGKPWSESIIVPFIVRWPGHVPAGRKTSLLISHVDIMPTLLGISKMDIPGGIDGVDLSTVVLGSDKSIQNSVFINYPVCPDKFSYSEWRGIVTERYTYARFREKPWVLYDDDADPFQMNNLIERSNNDRLISEMNSLLEIWMKKMDDPFETSDEVSNKYYKGSEKGVMPYYQNKRITSVMDKRKRERETNS